ARLERETIEPIAMQPHGLEPIATQQETYHEDCLWSQKYHKKRIYKTPSYEEDVRLMSLDEYLKS
ncbi:MAG: hypothetical protein F6K11_37980, partial [Leptolyngbya sp. SIO3F4]|nr:hypothetical protein [Leptolyngbya sp. SIO3F4]